MRIHMQWLDNLHAWVFLDLEHENFQRDFGLGRKHVVRFLFDYQTFGASHKPGLHACSMEQVLDAVNWASLFWKRTLLQQKKEADPLQTQTWRALSWLHKKVQLNFRETKTSHRAQ